MMSIYRTLVFFCSAAIIALLLAGCPGSPPVVKPDRLAVTGFIVASPSRDGDVPPEEPGGRQIRVPGVRVALQDLNAGSDVEDVRTDLSGRFRFTPTKPGDYQVCWKAPGFVSMCGPKFNLADRHHYLGEVRAALDTANIGTTFFGRVTLAGGASVRRLEPVFGVNAFATVNATDDQGTDVGTAYVNNFGVYLLPALAPSGKYDLVASIEAGSATKTVVSPGPSQQVDLEIADHPPAIQGLVRDGAGGQRWTAAPGDLVTVRVTASDVDGDPLQYRWLLPDGDVLPPSGSDSASFQLPPQVGSYAFTALVSDGKGGYSSEDVTINTSGVRFGGIVAATDAPVVAGAEIEINGTTTSTSAEGRFALFVPESDRYVLNIRKRGYGLVSKIYDNGLTGGRWTLTRASVHVVDPGQPIDVTNERRPEDCPGSLSDRWGYRRGQDLDKPDDRDQDPGKPYDRECGPGIRVQIPANALECGGNPPVGDVSIELTTVDLRAPDGMPGDYTARPLDDPTQVRVMESYGAGTVEIFDSNGTPCDLAGETAAVDIPIDSDQLAFPASIPASIAFLSYDEQAGVWLEESELQRVGNVYEVKEVEHFSAFNADTLKVNQACIRLETVLMPAEFKLEARVPQNGAFKLVTNTVTNENQRFHALYNLPTNENIRLRVFDSNNALIQLLDVNNLGVAINEINVSSGGPQNPTDPNQPAFPYAACQVSVELTPFTPVGQAINQFLHGFSFQSVNLTELDGSNAALSQQFKDAAAAYYLAIDPHSKRDTLAKFQSTNGFPAAEVTLQYANSGDLGFGRDMHCRKVSNFGATGEYACYVTNYGSRFTDDGQDYLDALTNTVPIATVGMEYSRAEDPNDENVLIGQPFVKFYVYKEANSNQVAGSANLDGAGERPVPQLCMVCHGGHYPNGLNVNQGVPAWTDSASANLGARFIPFDLASLFMLNPNGAQNQTKLRQLNCDIVRNSAPSQELLDVIASMYGAGCAGNQQLGNPVPGWVDASPSTPNLPNKEEVYAQVVTPSCRACHVSTSPSNITWATANDFQANVSIPGLVCTSHAMPHALVTHNRFWLSTSPHQPLLLHNFLNGNDPPLDPGSTAIDCVEAFLP